MFLEVSGGFLGWGGTKQKATELDQSDDVAVTTFTLPEAHISPLNVHHRWFLNALQNNM